MTRSWKFVALGVTVVALVSFYVMWRLGLSEPPSSSEVQRGSAQKTSQGETTASSGNAAPKVGAPSDSSTAEQSGQPTSTLSERLKTSTDYWEFANQLLGAAQSGEPESQYYLFRVLEYCRDRGSFFLKKGTKVLTPDEVLQYAARRTIPQHFAQVAFDRCHEFLTDDSDGIGSEDKWLASAAKAGVPEAQADAAMKLIIFRQAKGMTDSGGEALPGYESKLPIDETPESLLREAIKSRSPHVLARIADALPAIGNPNSPDLDTERYALLLLACERGYDCTSDAEWVQASCGFNPHCSAYSDSTQRVMELAGSSWPAVQERAVELGQKIDVGAWDDLGLTSEALED